LLKNKDLPDDEELREKGVGGDCDDHGESEMVSTQLRLRPDLGSDRTVEVVILEAA